MGERLWRMGMRVIDKIRHPVPSRVAFTTSQSREIRRFQSTVEQLSIVNKASIMEAEERDRLTLHADTLRSELKVWEKEIAARTGGKKPSREEIKSNSSIG